MQKLESIKNILQRVFQTDKISAQGETLKVHVKELNSIHIIDLSTLVLEKGCKVDCKRSGTGITVLVTI